MKIQKIKIKKDLKLSDKIKKNINKVREIIPREKKDALIINVVNLGKIVHQIIKE